MLRVSKIYLGLAQAETHCTLPKTGLVTTCVCVRLDGSEPKIQHLCCLFGGYDVSDVVSYVHGVERMVTLAWQVVFAALQSLHLLPQCDSSAQVVVNFLIESLPPLAGSVFVHPGFNTHVTSYWCMYMYVSKAQSVLCFCRCFCGVYAVV